MLAARQDTSKKQLEVMPTAARARTMPPQPPLDSTAGMNDDDAQNANDIRNEQVPEEENNTIKNDNFQPTTTTTHPNETHIKKRPNRAICKHPSGCTNQVVNNSLCVKHGAVIKRCSTANCTNYAQVGGVCTRHGAKKKIKLCLAEGCQNQVRNGGVCRRHGARDGRDRNNNGGGEKRTRQSLEIISAAEQTKDKDGSAMKKTATRSSSKRNRPCTQEGCPNQAYSGGVCRRHGAKVKLCSFGGCSSQAKKGGVCVKHRTLMMSSSDTAAAAGGDGAVDGNVAATCPVVVKPSGDHGDATSQNDTNSAAAMSGPGASAAPAPQSIQKVSQSNDNLPSKLPPPPPLPNPKSIERKRQSIQKTLNNNLPSNRPSPPLPKRIKRKCSSKECTNHIVNNGVCVKHGAKVKSNRCTSEGCRKYAINGGVCITHGATWTKKICTHSEGCTNYVVRKGLCVKHGATWTKKFCTVEGCTNQRKKGGVCIRHGARVALCRVEGCGKQTQYGGLCWSHGGTGGTKKVSSSSGGKTGNGVKSKEGAADWADSNDDEMQAAAV